MGSKSNGLPTLEVRGGVWSSTLVSGSLVVCFVLCFKMVYVDLRFFKSSLVRMFLFICVSVGRVRA